MEEERHQGADYYGYGNSNSYGDYSSSSYSAGYDYQQPQGYGSFSVDNSGRAIDETDNHLLNTYWANMHRQWGHQRETRLNDDGTPNNNLVVSTQNSLKLNRIKVEDYFVHDLYTNLG